MYHNLCCEYFYVHKHYIPIQSTVEFEKVVAIFTRALQEEACRNTPPIFQMTPTPLSPAVLELCHAR